jgi:hypothetical protein
VPNENPFLQELLKTTKLMKTNTCSILHFTTTTTTKEKKTAAAKKKLMLARDASPHFIFRYLLVPERKLYFK